MDKEILLSALRARTLDAQSTSLESLRKEKACRLNPPMNTDIKEGAISNSPPLLAKVSNVRCRICRVIIQWFILGL